MADVSPRLFTARLAFKLGVQFRDMARKESRSEAISRSLRVEVLNFGLVAVETPFYWAVYYHDGRGAIRARPGHKLVYFRNPDDDPRISGRNYPVRAADVRRLTKSQFYRFLRNPASGMVVRDAVGPAAGDPFFTRAGRRFKAIAGRTAEPQVGAYVRGALGDLLDVKGKVSLDI